MENKEIREFRLQTSSLQGGEKVFSFVKNLNKPLKESASHQPEKQKN